MRFFNIYFGFSYLFLFNYNDILSIVKEFAMQNNDIINVILSDLAHEKVKTGYGVNSGIISDVVEGWNQNIYVVPNKIVLNKHLSNKKFDIM